MCTLWSSVAIGTHCGHQTTLQVVRLLCQVQKFLLDRLETTRCCPPFDQKTSKRRQRDRKPDDDSQQSSKNSQVVRAKFERKQYYSSFAGYCCFTCIMISDLFTLRIPPPPAPNTINTANGGRFRLNVDSPYGEREQSTALTRAPPRRPARPRRDFIFNLRMRDRRQAPSPFAFTMPEEEGTFDSVSAHLLATAANIFGWAGDPTE